MGATGVSLGGGHKSSIFHDVICLENLFSAWKEFSKGKKSKKDVLNFSLNLENNIFQLRNDVLSDTWKPEPYKSFYISDPKLRHIHKASVRDRVLYQAVYRILYNHFDKNFIFDSYSSRVGKGTHAGFNQLESFIKKLSNNYTKQVFVLKCDVKKFFDSIDHKLLISFLETEIQDEKLIRLLKNIISSFEKEQGKGLPLGNVTSQLFANIYLNPLDWFIKKDLKVKYYIRYCDDFVILSQSKQELINLLQYIIVNLNQTLKLSLHPSKVDIRNIKQGVDFLGYVALPHYSILRTKTKKRIFRKLKVLIKENHLTQFEKSRTSYLGLISHCRSNRIRQKLNKISM